MSTETKSLNFIEQIIEEDLKNGLAKEKLHFRFPPEPNGYLHIGHAAAICLNFGLGADYNAPVNLRFDDTNPVKEEQEYVDAIKKDISWLGFKWANECYSSDYFQQLYNWAIVLIKNGKAYVDSQSSEAMREQKGTPTTVGVNSPHRNQTVAENLALFEQMKNGELEEGSSILRAKIDMESTNMLMRDPIIYRVLKKEHHRTGTDWCIYPMYDWAHGESDYIEEISHSICTLEFKPHRELYNWFLDQIYDKNIRPKQREFARRNLSYTIMSKRKLLKLVEANVVNGWDDPRMPTISGLRRRGYTAAAIRKFSEVSGISKRDSVTDVSLLEFCVREDLNKTAERVMAVINPLKVIITNYPEDKEEYFTADKNPEDENSGTHKVPFSRAIYIEKEDFKEVASNKFFRLKLGKEVRLKNGYIIKADSCTKDANGNIIEVQCTADLDSRSGTGTEASKRHVKGTLHWVSIKHAVQAEVRVYDRLFLDEAPDSHSDTDFMEFINPNSLHIIKNAFVEPYLKEAKIGAQFQFQRLGYFNIDDASTADKLVFNKTVGLKDSWAKQKPKQDNKPKVQQVQAQQSEKNPLNEIKKLGKKLGNLSGGKYDKAKAKILTFAEEVTYTEIAELFDTPAKKVGNRIAVALALQVLVKSGQVKTEEMNAFINLALTDENKMLVTETEQIK